VPFGRPDNNYDLRGPEVDFFHNPFPSSIVGLEGYAIENVVLENIEINYWQIEIKIIHIHNLIWII
jgi:hypothetical protein